jgi:uncharacterized protein (TIGR02466 family)
MIREDFKLEEHPIFSEYLFSEQMEVPEGMVDRILELESKNPTAYHTNIGGWQSKFLDYYDSPPLEELPNLILSIHNAVKILKQKYGIKFDKKEQPDVEYWISVNRRGHRVNYHDHLGSKISGVFYLTTPKGGQNIVFCRESQKVTEWFYPLSEQNQYNHNSFEVNVKPGMLLLFPSYLKHYVNESQTDEPRVNIGFNFN